MLNLLLLGLLFWCGVLWAADPEGSSLPQIVQIRCTNSYVIADHAPIRLLLVGTNTKGEKSKTYITFDKNNSTNVICYKDLKDIHYTNEFSSKDQILLGSPVGKNIFVTFTVVGFVPYYSGDGTATSGALRFRIASIAEENLCIRNVWRLLSGLSPPPSPRLNDSWDLLRVLGCEWGTFPWNPSVLILISKPQPNFPKHFIVQTDLSNESSRHILTFSSTETDGANLMDKKPALFCTAQRDLRSIHMFVSYKDSPFCQEIPASADPDRIFFVTFDMELVTSEKKLCKFVSTGAHFVTPLTASAILGGVIPNNGRDVSTPEELFHLILRHRGATAASPYY